MLGTLISLIITIFLLYVIRYTKVEDTKPAWYIYVIVLLLGSACPLSALILLCIISVILYKGYIAGTISTLNWIESIFKRINNA